MVEQRVEPARTPVGLHPSLGALVGFAANLVLAYVAWQVLHDGAGTLTRSEFEDWLTISIVSGASWAAAGLALLPTPARRLGLALTAGVVAAGVVCACALLVIMVAAGS